MKTDLIAHIDAVREARGFLSIEAAVALSTRNITVLDPFSTLISRQVELSPGIVIWPNVTISVGREGMIRVGPDTALYSGVRIQASAGRIVVGGHADLGQEGGFTLQADAKDDAITLGDHVRLNGGGSIAIGAEIGDGAQVLGAIRVQNCRLGSGGSFRDHDPDRRGGVLKGCGVARNLDVPTGMVIQAFGIFAEAPLRQQSYFHPAPTVDA